MLALWTFVNVRIDVAHKDNNQPVCLIGTVWMDPPSDKVDYSTSNW